MRSFIQVESSNRIFFQVRADIISEEELGKLLARAVLSTLARTERELDNPKCKFSRQDLVIRIETTEEQ